jgi:hypothetical protein
VKINSITGQVDTAWGNPFDDAIFRYSCRLERELREKLKPAAVGGWPQPANFPPQSYYERREYGLEIYNEIHI